MVVRHKKLLSSASPIAAFLWQRRPRSERLIATTRSSRGFELAARGMVEDRDAEWAPLCSAAKTGTRPQ